MSRQAQADREKQARIILGQAELEIAASFAQAATSYQEAERFDLVVGITGHAAYHAGQVQLIKKLI